MRLEYRYNVLSQLTEVEWGGKLDVWGSVEDSNVVMVVGGVTSAPPYYNGTNWHGGGDVSRPWSNSIPIVAWLGTNSMQTNVVVYMPPEKPQGVVVGCERQP